MIQELRYAISRHLRTPAQLGVITLILGLGIGATTTIFSVVNGVLLRPLPFSAQDRLLVLWQRAPGVEVEEDWFSTAQYFDIREQADCFDETAILFGRQVTLTGDGADPERLGALEVSSSFFNMLDLQPSLGRALAEEDDMPGSGRKTLISRRLFERRYGSDPGIIGRSIEVDGRNLEVVGILPRLPLNSELFPTLVTVPHFDLVSSLPVEDSQTTRPGSENYNIMARTAPGTSMVEVESKLLTIAAEFVKDPGSLGAGLRAGPEYRIGAVPLIEQVSGHVKVPLLVLMGATILLLVISCANVANLLLTSAAIRRREYGIRTALGAPRWRMISQALSESLLLALLGGLLGLLIASTGVDLLRWAAPENLPRIEEIQVDPWILFLTVLLCLGSSLLFGLAPALNTSSIPPSEVLHETSSRGSAHSLWKGAATYLVVLQVALSLVLACGAGLTIRTFQELQKVDPGFQAEGVLSFRLSLTGERYQTREGRLTFFDQLHDRLRALVGVEAVGGVTLLPLTRNYAWTNFYVEGIDSGDDKRDRTVADVNTASAGYFETMNVPLLAGRTFNRTDAAEPLVVLVNRAFAERFWPLEEAVGKWTGRSRDNRSTIIGIVENIRHYGLDQESRPAVIYPYPRSANRTLYTVLRTAGDPVSVAEGVVSILRDLDPLLPVYDVRSMTDRVANSLARQRLLMTLLNLFSAIATVLAVVGMYGVLSFTVATQTREIGIRQALGAQRRDIYLLIFRGAGIVTGLGILIGLVSAFLAARGLDGLVWGLNSRDIAAYFFASLLIVLVAAAASLVPARRAASIDPMVALRDE